MAESKAKVLTLTFTDLVDSTALKNTHGDGRAAGLINECRELVSNLATEHGGSIIDWAGDGCFLVFDTTSSAVSFALGVQLSHGQNSDLPAIRIGLHLGEVSVTEDGDTQKPNRVEGLAVDVGARIQSLARPNQILMSRAVLDSARQRLRDRKLPGKVEWREHGQYALKGLDDPVDICEVGLRGTAPLKAPDNAEKAKRASATTPDNRADADKPRSQFMGIVNKLSQLMKPGREPEEDRKDWARERVLPEIVAQVDSEQFSKAFRRAQEIETLIPNDPILASLWDRMSTPITIETDPPGVDIFCKAYEAPDSEWESLGRTPIEKVRFSIGPIRLRLEHEDCNPLEVMALVTYGKDQGIGIAGTESFSSAEERANWHYRLDRTGEVPEDVVPVEATTFIPPLTNVPLDVYTLERFHIDRTPVTNRKYSEFVAAGGYADSQWWPDSFEGPAGPIDRQDALSRFVDSTGRPGPATWEVGTYPAGEDEYPVRGISWYEAQAYAQFRGKHLPTAAHWALAALHRDERVDAVAPHIVAQSNFGTDGPTAVGQYPAVTPSGAVDMAGNVREWVWTSAGKRRIQLGGAWPDPSYAFINPYPQEPMDRSPENGMRCAVYPETYSWDAPEAQPIVWPEFEYEKESPHSEEALHIYRKLTSYHLSPLRPEIESSQSSGNGWRHEVVTVSIPGEDERLIIRLDIPETAKPPFHAVVVVAGRNALEQSTFEEQYWERVDFIPKSGRVLVRPVLKYTYERGGGRPAPVSMEMLSLWAREMRRVMDYLDQREDINNDSAAYYGISFGGMVAPVILGLEPRLKSAILIAAGAIPSKGVFGYVPWVKQPTLMQNGRFDCLFTVEDSQEPMYCALGAAEADKRHVVYDCGHLPLPRAESIKESLAWLDKYQTDGDK